MNLRRFGITLSIVNLGVLAFALVVLAQIRPAAALDVAPVLRGRAFELVDAQGRVRASIKIEVAGKAYPETVILRLIDPAGRPEVKLSASVNGGGIGFVGDNDETQVVLKADGTVASLRLANKDGRALLFKP